MFLSFLIHIVLGLPSWLSGKESTYQSRRHKRQGPISESGSSWSRKWQPTPAFSPGESHGQRSLVGYSPWGHKESDTTEVTCHSRVQHSTTNLSANSLNFLPYWYSSPLLNQKWKYVNLLYNSCQWLFFEPIHNPPHFKTPFFPMYLPQDKV